MESLISRIEAILPSIKSHLLQYWKRWLAVLASVIVLAGVYYYLFSPPTNFPSGSIITIVQGASAPLIAQELASDHIIKHPTLLKLLLRITRKSDSIQAGAYKFQTPQNLFEVAYRIVTGAYGIPSPRITFIEGATLDEMAEQISEQLPISKTNFLKAGGPYEGYLFPDTYTFSPVASADSIIQIMRNNFNTNTQPLFWEISSSRHSISDIVSMAAIIEKEARTVEDKKIISGILWNRISIGMALQVDAAPDTYKHTGFTAEPICNPGFDSIEAAVNPTKTKYMYYLTGKDGLMHYAITFAEHQANKNKYL